MLALIKELIAAQLVVEEGDDAFVFRHALTQQAIYSSLLARERRSLHLCLATALQSVYSRSLDAHLAELAHHFYQAGAWDEAYYYCRRIGDAAHELDAPRAAAQHYSRALEAADHLGTSPPASLYRARGACFELLGEFDQAREDFERSAGGSRAAGDLAGEWQACMDLGSLWTGRDYARSGEYYRQAEDLATRIDDPSFRAKTLNRIGNWLVNTGRPLEGIACHNQALATFEERGDHACAAETHDLLGMANGLYGDLPRSAEHYDRAVEMLRPLGNSRSLARSRSPGGRRGAPRTTPR
jgi:tetratricopeptide (TPR) repeat protein